MQSVGFIKLGCIYGTDSGPFWWMKEGTFAPKKIKKLQ